MRLLTVTLLLLLAGLQYAFWYGHNGMLEYWSVQEGRCCPTHHQPIDAGT